MKPKRPTFGFLKRLKKRQCYQCQFIERENSNVLTATNSQKKKLTLHWIPLFIILNINLYFCLKLPICEHLYYIQNIVIIRFIIRLYLCLKLSLLTRQLVSEGCLDMKVMYFIEELNMKERLYIRCYINEHPHTESYTTSSTEGAYDALKWNKKQLGKCTLHAIFKNLD